MSERPILMNAAMVRAILEGRKTQTRRPVKTDIAGRVSLGGRSWHIDDPNCIKACPLGKPGDRLWVRETFAIVPGGKGLRATVRYAADGALRAVMSDVDVMTRYGINASTSDRWRPSIHMPRWASRFILEITDVRVERVQDISEAGAMAEGIELPENGTWRDYCVEPESNEGHYWCKTAVNSYRTLWDTLYWKSMYAWTDNPRVWVTEFKRIEA